MHDAESLIIDLPPGWVERPNPGGPREFSPSPDGNQGILQVSRLEGVPADEDLGRFAANLGVGFGQAGQNWGAPIGAKTGACALGQFGVAVFRGGEFPGMMLWVAQSPSESFLWSWLGPSMDGAAVEQALRVVISARLP
jgi:hypothetical protein